MTRKNLLKGLVLPKNTDYKIETDEKEGGKKAVITAYPFDRGFGTTIGNTLRRALLSSIPGFAVSAIMLTQRVDGKTVQITNEFETINGVKEDILEIIAALKKLEIKVDSSSTDSIQFIVECKGPGVITGKDFEKNGITIMNKDLVVMTMEKDCDLDLEIQIDYGKGYISCDEHEERSGKDKQFGVIAVDSIFSPVKNVKYNIEPTRFGDSSEYDKLVMEVWTDGTITAAEAVAQAACITQQYLEKFINFDKTILSSVEEINKSDNTEFIASSIDELELGDKVNAVFERLNIKTVGDLISKTEEELKEEKFTAPALKKIKEKLAEKNLSLGKVNTKLIN